MSIIIRAIAKYRLWRLKTLGSFSIFYDTILFIFVIIMMINFEFYRDEKKEILISYLTRDWNKTIINHPGVWDYVDFPHLVEKDFIIDQIGVIVIFLCCFRNLFFLLTSLVIKYMINLFFMAAKRLFNVFVIVILFTLSFSIFFHIILGKKVFKLSDLTNTIIIALQSLLGKFSSSDFENLTITNSIIIICFLAFIKYILLTYVFALNQETYLYIKSQYKTFKKKEHYSIIGESLFIYFKYAFIVFLIKDWFFYHYRYGSTNYERLINEMESKGKIKRNKREYMLPQDNYR